MTLINRIALITCVVTCVCVCVIFAKCQVHVIKENDRTIRCAEALQKGI